MCADAAPCISGGFPVIGPCRALVVSNIVIVECNEACCGWCVGRILLKWGYFRQGDPRTHVIHSKVPPAPRPLTPGVLLNSRVHHPGPDFHPPSAMLSPPIEEIQEVSIEGPLIPFPHR